MKKTPEEKLADLCQNIRQEIQHWKDLNQNGGSDPFWPDGCNMNLTRNHIVYYKQKIAEICEEKCIMLPDEFFYSLPPEVDTNYMARRNKKERMDKLKRDHNIVFANYSYDEYQISLF